VGSSVRGTFDVADLRDGRRLPDASASWIDEEPPMKSRQRRLARLVRNVSILLLGAFVVGCDKPIAPLPAPAAGVASISGQTPQSLEKIQMKIAGRMFTIEVADEPREREIGLMHRSQMPIDHGMIFAWPLLDRRSFYMKNTRISLDIMYIDSAGIVVDIQQMKAFDLSSYPSAKPAQYAIELNEGVSAKIGLKVGDKIEIPAKLASSKPD